MGKKVQNKSSKNPIGHPVMYRAEYCELLVEHMSQGFSFEAFAGKIGVSRRALYDWLEKYSEFASAKEIADEKCRLCWEDLGIKHILNISESHGDGIGNSKSLNSTVWIFNMKNRFKWRDKQPDESDVVVNNITSMTDEQLDAKIDEKMKKLSGKT